MGQCCWLVKREEETSLGPGNEDSISWRCGLRRVAMVSVVCGERERVWGGELGQSGGVGGMGAPSGDHRLVRMPGLRQHLYRASTNSNQHYAVVEPLSMRTPLN